MKFKKYCRMLLKEELGKNCSHSGYSVAGKTGTAQKPKANGQGYEPGKYVSSFIGFFPVIDPEIVILVAVDSPKNVYYGSAVAGPVFANCAKFLIDNLNIKPDELVTKK